MIFIISLLLLIKSKKGVTALFYSLLSTPILKKKKIYIYSWLEITRNYTEIMIHDINCTIFSLNNKTCNEPGFGRRYFYFSIIYRDSWLWLSVASRPKGIDTCEKIFAHSQKRKGRMEREGRGERRWRREKRKRETRWVAEYGCMEPTGRDARAGASVVGGKREFALSHPRIYPTPSSQGAGLRYHPCRPAPRPSVFSPAFFSPIGRPSRRPAGDAPFADRTRVGVRVLQAPRRRVSTPLPIAHLGHEKYEGRLCWYRTSMREVSSFSHNFAYRLSAALSDYTLGLEIFV